MKVMLIFPESNRHAFFCASRLIICSNMFFLNVLSSDLFSLSLIFPDNYQLLTIVFLFVENKGVEPLTSRMQI